jgi:hypothetical protein
MTESKWASRGWTLQESALLTREVIFTGQYVFFRRRKALWGEDFGLKLSTFRGDLPGWELPLHRISTAQNSLRHYSDVYPRLVAQYVRRDLTNEEDILNAFFGILNRLEASTGPHLWGMPSKEFGSALLWSADMSFPIKRRQSFPSWSWAGWFHSTVVPGLSDFGTIHISPENSSHDDMYHGFDSPYHSGSIIRCFNVGNDAKIQCFDSNLDRIGYLSTIQEGEADQNSLFSEETKAHFTPPMDYEHILYSYVSQSHFGPLLSHYVFFWASCASLYVDLHPSTNWRGEITLGRFAIYNRPKSTRTAFEHDMGYVRLDAAWRERQPEMLEFAVTTGGIMMVNLYDRNKSEKAARILFKVILIENCGDSSLKVYKRVPATISTIMEHDWSDAKPQQRLIALI